MVERISVMQYRVRAMGAFYEPVPASRDTAMEDKDT